MSNAVASRLLLRSAVRVALAVTLAGLSACTLVVMTLGPPITRDDPFFRVAVIFDESYLGVRNAAPGARALAFAPQSTAAEFDPFTPTAAFLGNQTARLGGALKPTSVMAGSVYVREPNCSLTQYAFADTANNATPVLTRLTGLDAYVRTLAALPAGGGTFPRGCADRRTGTPSGPGGYLGRAANGDLLVAVLNGTPRISVVRLNDQGRVVGSTTLSTATAGTTLALADLNGDGIADIVTPWINDGTQTGIGVFLSRADGSFGAVTVYPFYPAGTDRFGRVSVEDINGDGRLDIVAVAASQNSGTLPAVVALLGNGDGTFRLGSVTTRDVYNSAFVLADFNGDGKTDLLTAFGRLLPGNGDGTFGPVASVWDIEQSIGGGMAVGDFNGDGKLDVALAYGLPGSTITVLLGGGDGTFTQKASYAGVRGAASMVVTDLDGDGVPDLFVGVAGAGVYTSDERTSTVTQFLLGKGDGTFRGAPVLAGLATNSLLPGAPLFALADLTGDGVADIAVPAAGQTATLLLHAGRGDGSFAPPAAPIALPFRAQMLSAADINGDGLPDVVVAATSGQLAVLPGRAGGGFGPAQAYALPAVDAVLSNLAVGDVNGDGRADVVVTMRRQQALTGGAFVYIANADGTLRAPVQVDPATNLGALAVVDLTGDGRADIVVGGLDPQFYVNPGVLRGVRVWRSNADGTFTATATLTLAGNVDYPALTLGDLNGDGKRDLVFIARNSSLDDTVVVAPGQGDGTFGAPSVLPLPGGGALTKAVLVADLTGDGKADVLLAADYPQILAGNGDGTLRSPTALVIGSGATGAVVADLNRDGQVDAVLATQSAIVPLLRTPSVIGSGPPPPPPVASFTLAATPTTSTVTAGQSASAVIALTPSNGYAEPVALACSGLPAAARCSFAPATLQASGNAPVSSTLTIGTTASSAGGGFTRGWDGPGDGTALTLLASAATLMALAMGLRGRRGRRSRTWPVVAGLGAAALLNACGGSGDAPDAPAPPTPPAVIGTPPGTYTVTVTATGTTLTRTTSVVLTVR